MDETKKRGGAKQLLQIFLVCLKLGALTFGGGFAMIPMIERDFSVHRPWLTREEMQDIIALSQSVPGAMAVNLGILAGYRIHGVVGGIVAGIGMVLPSLFCIMAITALYELVIENEWVQAAMRGLRAGVLAMVTVAAIRLTRTGMKDVTQWIIGILALLGAALAEISAIYLILGAGLAGILLRFRKGEAANE